MKKHKFRLNSELHLTRQWRTALNFGITEFPEGSGIKWMRIELPGGEVMYTSPDNIDVILEKTDRVSDDD